MEDILALKGSNQSWSSSTVGNALALESANPGSNPSVHIWFPKHCKE